MSRFRIRMGKDTAWVEESFHFDEPYQRQVHSPGTSRFVNTSFFGWHQKTVFACLLVMFLLVAGRTAWLQLWQGGALSERSARNRERSIPIPAERGLVYDRHNQVLTKNIPNFSLAIVPQDLPRNTGARRSMIERLAALVGSDPNDLEATINEFRSYQYESITIADDIPFDTALLVLAQASDLPGITIERGSKRMYAPERVPGKSSEIPNADLSYAFAPVLGYVGKLTPKELDSLYANGYLPSDTIGKSGVEKVYEASLRGRYGRRRIEVNAFGREQSVLSEEAPEPGKHIRLSIDERLQKAVYDIMKKNFTAMGKARGAAVILHAQTGEVLALVNVPSYDNNDFSGGILKKVYTAYVQDPNQPLFPRAWAGQYPSGSSIKPAIAVAALTEGIITESTSFLSSGGLRVGQWFFPDWLAGGHGSTNVRKSLAWSVNTFYYYIGGGYNAFAGMGIEKMTDFLRRFSFGSVLGIDLPGEVSGFLPSKEWKQKTKGEQWYIGDTYNVSIGQGDVLVTPLQIAAMTAAIANGGTLYQPRVVSAIIDPVIKSEKAIPKTIIRDHIAPSAHLKTVRLGMRDCVVYGSCRSLSALPVLVAGKTGTAQWSADKANHGWFTSFAPYDNPEIVVTVLVEEAGEGSSTAAPIAKDIYAWWALHRDTTE